MSSRHPSVIAVPCVLVALCLAGCFSNSTQYHTAETLPEGGLIVGGALYTTDVMGVCMSGERDGEAYEDCDELALEDSVQTRAFGVLPDIFVRYGILDDLEVGGRATVTGLAFDVKWRFVDTEHFDMAIDPTMRANFPYFAAVSEVGLDLPLMFAFRPASWFQVYTSVRGLTAWWRLPQQDADDAEFVAFGVSTNVGLSFETRGFFIRPEFSYNNYLAGLSVAEAEADEMNVEYYNIGIGLGARFGDGGMYPGAVAGASQ